MFKVVFRLRGLRRRLFAVDSGELDGIGLRRMHKAPVMLHTICERQGDVGVFCRIQVMERRDFHGTLCISKQVVEIGSPRTFLKT